MKILVIVQVCEFFYIEEIYYEDTSTFKHL